MRDYINNMLEDIKELSQVYTDIEAYIKSFIEYIYIIIGIM